MNAIYSLMSVSIICISLILILNSTALKNLIVLTKNSRDLNPANELKLLNTIIYSVLSRYIRVHILQGDKNKNNIKTSMIPMGSDDMQKHQSDIYDGVISQLSQTYLNRIKFLYINDIENYIKFEISERYVREVYALKMDKKIIAREELSDKEQEHIGNIVNIITELKTQHGIDINTLAETLTSNEDYSNGDSEFLLDESYERADIYNIVSSVIEEYDVDKTVFKNFVLNKGGML